MYKSEDMDLFKVCSLDNKFTFFHIKFNDTEEFYEGLFEYFFNENKLISYIENKTYLKFSPEKKNFVTLYKNLAAYIDDFYDEIDISEIDCEVKKIINDEYETVEEKEDALKIRADKKGKIGEYIFSCLLKEYFKFDCIIPKVHLSTSRNMSVFGIDTLFYSSKDNMLLFGESKISNSLSNGIGLIKESLKGYEKSIQDEYTLILSNRIFKEQLNKFTELFGDISEISIDIYEFIKKANIKKIGIPIFIGHGTEQVVDEIIKKLGTIAEKDMLNLQTIYYFISLPILNKQKFMSIFTKKIKEKRDEYESNSK